MTFLLNNGLNPSVLLLRPLGSAQMLEIVQCCQLPVSRSVWRQCAGATFASKTVGLWTGFASGCSLGGRRRSYHNKCVLLHVMKFGKNILFGPLYSMMIAQFSNFSAIEKDKGKNRNGGK